ncbi:MAG: hypothetical protein NTX03_04330, partial [Bacteroidetes bacterium]|nr:hypothetical protein [Bacteroidota bacterium]
MTTNKKLLFILSLLLWVGLMLPNSLQATHLAGGDATYKYYKGNQFIVRFSIYRDCSSGTSAMPDTIHYYIFSASTNKYYSGAKLFRYGYPAAAPKVYPHAINCAPPSGVCIQEGLFYDTITLGTDTVGYHISFGLGNRNKAILNLDLTTMGTPQAMIWYCFVPPVKYKNSSVQFLSTPLPAMCPKVTNIFSQDAYDPDNDSLVFTSDTPWSSKNAGFGQPIPTPPPYLNCVYNSGYSYKTPLGGSATFSVDSSTGLMTAKPSGGGVYVIAISIKEYRYDPVYGKSVYMGEVRRDYEFFVATSCPVSGYGMPIYITDGLGYNRKVDPDSTICFTVKGYSKSPSDSVYLWATGHIFKGAPNAKMPYATCPNDTVQPKDTAVTQFCWTPSCDQVTYTTPYVVTFYLSDNSCNVANIQYKISVTPRPLHKGPDLRCLDIVSTSSIKLTYKPISVTTFKQYYIYRRKGQKGTYAIIDSVSTMSSTGYTDNSVTNTATDTYYYYIRSENTCDFQGLPSDTLTSITLSTKLLGDKAVRFSWPKHRYYGSFYYRIYQDAGSGSKLVDSTKNTYYYVASCSKTFNFKVTVFDGKGNCTSNSNSSGTVTLKDVTPPNLNGIINTTTINYGQINLSFKASDSGDIRIYQIYRQPGASSYSLYDSVKPVKGKLTYMYNDTKSVSAKAFQYHYKIRAIDTCGNISSYTAVHAPSLLSGTTGNLVCNLTWTKYSGYSYDTVEVQRLNSGIWTTIKSTNLTDTTFSDTNVTCNVTYNYRIVHREAGGNGQYTYSDSIPLQPFDTISPMQVNILSATVKDKSNIIVSFNKVTDKDVKKYSIYLSTNGKAPKLYNTIIPTGTSPYSTTITGLKTQDSTYSIQIRAVDSCKPNTSPTTETHKVVLLTGTAGPLLSDLKWSTYKGFTVKNYVVQKRVGTSWTTLTTLTATDSAYKETGLQCGVPFYYRIQINENGGASQVSYSDSVSVIPYDTVTPPKVKTYYASVISPTSIEFAFDKVSGAPRVKFLEVQCSTNGGAYKVVGTIANTFVGTYKFKLTGLKTADSTYYFRVVSLDSCGGAKSKQFDTHRPVLLKGFAKNQSNQLNWTKYKDYTVKNYIIQRKTTGAWANLISLPNTDTTYSDTPLACYIKYHYRIIATENGGNLSQSISDSINLTPFDTIRPDAPVIKYVTMSNDSTVYIAWNKTKAPDVKKYNVYRKPMSSGAFTKIATVNIDSFYSDKQASKVTESYCYKVEAVDSCSGNISPQSSQHCTEYLTSFVHGCKQQISLHWNLYSYWSPGVLKYKIFRKTNSGAEVHIATVASTLDSFVDATSIDFRNIHHYRIAALNKTDSTTTSFSQISTNRANGPQTPWIYKASKISTSATTGQIVIKWQKQNYPTRYIKTHTLYFRKVGTAAFSVLSANMPITTDSFIHSGLNTASANYEYKMIATDSCGIVSDTSPVHRTMEFTMTVGQLTHRLYWTPY